MAVAGLEDIAQGEVRCPTCNAKQPYADTCRRCKCDLGLLKSMAEASLRTRRRCLVHLRAGRISAALAQARRAFALRPEKRSARLLAVCHLLNGDFREATRAARTGK